MADDMMDSKKAGTQRIDVLVAVKAKVHMQRLRKSNRTHNEQRLRMYVVVPDIFGEDSNLIKPSAVRT